MAAATSPREPNELQHDAEALLGTNPAPLEANAPTRSWPSRTLLASAVAVAAVLLLAGAALRGQPPQTPAAAPAAPGAEDAGPARGLLEDAELRRALLDAISAGGHPSPGPSRQLLGPGANTGHRARLLRVVRHLRNLSLRRSRRLASDEAGVYEFECSNEDGPGTGWLGQAGMPGDGSASDVVVRTADSPVSEDTSMNFTIGPNVGVGDEHIISGVMDVLHASPEGLSGNITAGFINLRSTLSGTWESGPDGLDGAVQIHLSDPDLFLEEDWAWKPSLSVRA